ncbi:HAMP domain-containing protein [bacterium]|nr:HAMP domain-containing protein [bacterium]
MVGRITERSQAISWQHSFGSKLVTFFLILSLVPLIAASVMAYLRSEEIIHTQIAENLEDNVTLTAMAMEQWIDERASNVHVLAGSAALQSTDMDYISETLNALKASVSYYELISVIDTQGQTLYTTDGQSYNFSDRDYFQRAIRGQFTVSEMVISRVSGDMVFVVAAPLYTDGEVTGIVAANVKTIELAEIAKSSQEGETGETYLINSEGYLITPSRFTSQLIADGFIQERAELELQIDTVASRSVLAGDSGYQEYLDYRSNPVLGAYEPVDTQGLAWGLVSEIDVAEAFAQIYQLRNQFLLMALITAGLVIIVALWLSRNISRPLNVISQSAAALASGDIEQEVAHQGKDEIGLLADQFRRMIGYQQEMAQAAKLLAKGDLSAQVTPQSQKDVLGHAFQQMLDYQHEMATAASQLAQGNLAVKVAPKSEQDVLGNAFQQMVGYQQNMSKAMGEVAQGNLKVEVIPLSDKDVLGRAVFQMLAHLRKTVGSVQANARGLLSSSQQLAHVSAQANDATRQITETIDVMGGTTQQVAQTIGQVALGAAQQAEVMERSRMIVEEQEEVIQRITQGSMRQTQSIEAADQVFHGRLSVAIKQVESATGASEQAVSTAVQAAQSGTQAVSKTITGINSVAKTAEQVTHRISEMGKRSRQIGAIVQVINEIAERTNLLSLNAAIEAARAGEHGKGFAVVADEVRKLAERSAKSAEEITELVSTVQDAASQAVSAMEENDRQVQQGLETAGDAEHALAGIRSAMSQVREQMQQLQRSVADLGSSSQNVQEAMQQVAGVIEENMEATTVLTASHEPLRHAIEEIASVAEENSAAAEEVAASAEENSASVEEINAMTKSVNSQVEEVTTAVQSLSAMAADLQEIAASFQLNADTNPDMFEQRPVNVLVSNGKKSNMVGNGIDSYVPGRGNGWHN